ncbi:MAG: tRNA lysidine(34) synthetase TilS [Anaerohalosphaera sp.]|nr:tRNA lysidine(34) synthetase TilS [Anaerohalosphaera sp.]
MLKNRPVFLDNMIDPFETKLAEFITAASLFQPHRNILIALSGGADSIALTFALHRLNAQKIIDINLHIAHINHNLRGPDALADQNYVLDFAASLNIPTSVISVDTTSHAKDNSLSIETAGRNLRIAAFKQLADKFNCTAVATAHHKNDNAETIIHRLLRGTAYTGLAGIWPKKQFAPNLTFIRPLLCTTRAEIIDYCKRNDLNFRHDHTNDQLDFTRNRIRHQLLPHLQDDSSSDLTNLLNQLAAIARKLNKKITAQAETAWQQITTSTTPTTVTFDRSQFAALPLPIKTELTRMALTHINAPLRNITQTQYSQVTQLADSTTGKTIQLPNRITATTHSKHLTFTIANIQPDTPPTQLNIPGQTTFANYTIIADLLDPAACDLTAFKAAKDNHTEWFDLDKITLPLTVRNRKTGDKFTPIGASTKQKAGKFLSAQRLAPTQKAQTFIITDQKKIIWLAPIRPSTKTTVDTSTKHILQIKLVFLHK